MSVRLIFNSVWQNPGNRGHRLSRLGRAAAWQLEKRTKRRPKTIRLPNGALFVAHPDCVVSSALIYADWPEFRELHFVRGLLQRDDVVIDVGANVGHVSLLLSDLVGAENIFAFEPTPISFKRLTENWKANGWTTQNLFQTAIGRSTGSVSVPDTPSPETKNAIGATGETRTAQVPIRSLDDLRSWWIGRSIGFLKIDVEGYEREVFAGAPELLREDRPRLIMFESLRGSAEEEIAATLTQARYRTFQLDDAGRPDFHEVSAQNLFAVPEENTSTIT
jgi:FkbM family methyltransferase